MLAQPFCRLPQGVNGSWWCEPLLGLFWEPQRSQVGVLVLEAGHDHTQPWETPTES